MNKTTYLQIKGIILDKSTLSVVEAERLTANLEFYIDAAIKSGVDEAIEPIKKELEDINTTMKRMGLK